MYPRIQIPFISPNNYIIVYLKGGTEFLWMKWLFRFPNLYCFAWYNPWIISSCGAVNCVRRLPQSLFHKSGLPFGFTGYWKHLFLGEIHGVSARRKRIGKHEFTSSCYFLVSHWNTFSCNQGTTITAGGLGHCRVRLHATTFHWTFRSW